jgi:hypothetical protein
MSRSGEAEDPRRRLLIQALAAGAFANTLAGREAMAQLLGSTPAQLPPGRSIYRLNGTVSVDGKPATLETKIGGRSTLETGRDGEVVYAVGQSAFIMRGESRVVLEAAQSDSAVLSGLRLLSGKLLSVFAAKRPMQLKASTATIGIRGTGVYMESDPEQTYFCTCYGVAEIASNSDPESKETVAAAHHDRPLYIVKGAPAGKGIREAPFVNHTDQELALVEALVGRKPPFVFPKSDYSGPRRNY